MSEFTNIYTNFSSTGNWDKADEEQDKIIALMTDLKDIKSQFAKLSKAPNTPAATGTARRGLESWKFENVGVVQDFGQRQSRVVQRAQPQGNIGSRRDVHEIPARPTGVEGTEERREACLEGGTEG